ncbi:uncharacterized protein LOC115703139 [Cannabis sativa]|uniref:uncharacterized protein LOC115703139 n=1 Tax=Cannabis sativa TaxID=3483 RepID=UPI0011E05599|nr:uncharacterized protein LOC115703139 [Cannabis sativa]
MVIIGREDHVEFDWRSRNILPPVRNQGKLNCCWAICAADVVASTFNALGREANLNLSPQHLVDFINWKCKRMGKGFPVWRALDYIRDQGITTEELYPFQGRRTNLDDNKKAPEFQKLYTIHQYSNVNQENIITTLRNRPMIIAAKFDKSIGSMVGDWNIYTPNYEEIQCRGHGLLLVGYGKEIIIHQIQKMRNGRLENHVYNEEKPYWIVRSSWGPEWGRGGYARIARDSLAITAWSVQLEGE